MSIYIDKIQSFATQNKYTKWYCSIITTANSRINTSKTKHAQRKQAKLLLGTIEGHHILPKCMCNEHQQTDKFNYSYLTPREHVLVHILLTKMFNGELKKKMVWAAHRMLNKCESTRMYEYIRITHAVQVSLRKYSEEERKERSIRVKADWDGNDARKLKASIIFSHFRKTGVVKTKTEFSDEDRKMFSNLAKSNWDGNEDRRNSAAEIMRKRHQENPNMSRNIMNTLHENGTMSIACNRYWTDDNKHIRSEQVKARWDDPVWKNAQLKKRSHRLDNKETVLYAIMDMIVVEFKTMVEARKFIIAPSTGTFSKLVKETENGGEFTHKGVLFYKP